MILLGHGNTEILVLTLQIGKHHLLLSKLLHQAVHIPLPAADRLLLRLRHNLLDLRFPVPEQAVRQIQQSRNRKPQSRSRQQRINMEKLQNAQEQKKSRQHHTRSAPFAAFPGFLFHLPHALHRHILLINLPLHLLFRLRKTLLRPAAFLFKNRNSRFQLLFPFFQPRQRFFLFLLQAFSLLFQ